MIEKILNNKYSKYYEYYLDLFLYYIKDLLDLLSGKTSFKIYLAFISHMFPSFSRKLFKEGEVLKWKGRIIEIPKVIEYPPSMIYEFFPILGGQYSIPECHIKTNDIVLDVGAHFGFFSYYALKHGAKRIYAFEPNPYVFKILEKHAEMWDRKVIKVFNLALYSFEGILKLKIPKNKTLHGLATVEDLKKQKEIIELKVKCTTIDKFVKKNRIKRIDFIKIDAEGSEKEIIKGARETIKKFKPRMAISAYHSFEDKEKIPELILSIREDYKFKLRRLGEPDLFFF